MELVDSWRPFGDIFSAGCLREAHPCGHVRSLLVYAIRDSTNAPVVISGRESVVDTLRRGVVVPYSEFGKTTPNSSSASSTTPREVDSIPIPIRPRPTSGRLFSFLEGCGTLQAGVAWSKFQTRHHFITRVESESGSSGGGGM